MFGRWKRRLEEHRANKQEGDPHALDREGDPRGGVQNEKYRHADPRDLVEADGEVMSGPAGAPQDEEPRARDGESSRYNGGPLRGRLMVGRPALDRVVKVRILAPQPRKPA
jgi:hypothetical protein